MQINLKMHENAFFFWGSGVNALPEIVATADHMIILWDKTYFERLWCCAEVAIFCSTKRGANCVEFATGTTTCKNMFGW